MLLLLGWTTFFGKNSKTINLLWLLKLQDMDELDNWSWGGIGLAFLYDQLSLTSDSSVASCGGYMTLLVGWTLAHFARIDDEDYDPTVSPATIPDYAAAAPPRPLPPYEEVIVEQ